MTTEAEAARIAQLHRVSIERAAWNRYKESRKVARVAGRKIKELEADVDAYAKRKGLNNTDHMMLWDAARLIFLKWVGLERGTVNSALANARILLEDHAI